MNEVVNEHIFLNALYHTCTLGGNSGRKLLFVIKYVKAFTFAYSTIVINYKYAKFYKHCCVMNFQRNPRNVVFGWTHGVLV